MDRHDCSEARKWAYEHWHELNIHCHTGTIGAVFDFFAGTVKRAPLWWQNTAWNGYTGLSKSHAGCGEGISSEMRCLYGIYSQKKNNNKLLKFL